MGLIRLQTPAPRCGGSQPWAEEPWMVGGCLGLTPSEAKLCWEYCLVYRWRKSPRPGLYFHPACDRKVLQFNPCDHLREKCVTVNSADLSSHSLLFHWSRIVFSLNREEEGDKEFATASPRVGERGLFIYTAILGIPYYLYRSCGWALDI